MENDTPKENIEEDVVFEEDTENTHREKKDAIEKLKEKLKVCEEEKNRYLTAWQRDKADFVNARKDDERRNVDVIKFAKEELLSEIIPVLDSFDMAMKSPSWGEVSKEWRTGVEYIHSQLKTVLQNHGIEEINPEKKPFSAAEHHALGVIETDKKEEDHKILEVIQKGYRLNGKVIRPASVKVGEYKQ